MEALQHYTEKLDAEHPELAQVRADGVDAVMEPDHRGMCVQAAAHTQALQRRALLEQVAEIVRAECAARRGLVEQAAAAVMDEITTAVSQFLYLEPSPDLLTVTIHPVFPSSGHGRNHRPRPGGLFTDALKVAFIRHLPNAERLKSVVAERAELKLSSFEEELGAQRKRGAIDERLARVRMAVRGLVRALDVDESVPLDDAWLMALQAD